MVQINQVEWLQSHLSNRDELKFILSSYYTENDSFTFHRKTHSFASTVLSVIQLFVSISKRAVFHVLSHILPLFSFGAKFNFNSFSASST